jgi:hypothetical protein
VSLATQLCENRVVRRKCWRICQNCEKKFIKIGFGRIEEDFKDHLKLRRLVKSVMSELIYR